MYEGNESSHVSPVCGHQNQGVDGHIRCTDNDSLVQFTPKLTKVPHRSKSIVCCSERNTEQKEQQIRNLQKGLLGFNLLKKHHLLN